MKTKKRVLAAVAIAALSVTGAGAVLAHGPGGDRGSMMGPGYGQGMMGPGYGGHMMSPGMMMGPGYGYGSGMMGPGMMTPPSYGSPMMGPHMRSPYFGRGMLGRGFGDRVVPQQDLSVDDVRHFFEDRLTWRGNKRLKLGKVTEKDKNTFIAEIVTKDGSLVDKFEVDRHSGRMNRVDD